MPIRIREDGSVSVETDIVPEMKHSLPERTLWASVGYVERRRMASNPETGRGLLERLAADPLPLIRRAVAANPSTPSVTISRIATDPDHTIRAAVASNPKAADGVLDILSRDKSYLVKRQALLNPSLAESSKERVLSLLGDGERADLAADHRLPSCLMTTLANDEKAYVRRRLAGNSVCTTPILEKLSADPDEGVREAVASNPVATSDLLVSMSTDPSPRIRCLITENPIVPLSMREELIAQGDVMERLASKIQRNRPLAGTEVSLADMRKYVFGVAKEERLLAMSPLTPVETLRRLVKLNKVSILDALIRNPSTPADAYHEIALQLENTDLQRRIEGPEWALSKLASVNVLENETLHLLATSKFFRVRASIADDPRIEGDTLDVLSRDDSAVVRARAARNPNATETMLGRLAFDNDESVRLSVLCNPRVPKDVIGTIDFRRQRALARVLIARNPDIDSTILYNIVMSCFSGYWTEHTGVVRAEVAQNPRATPDLLELLAHDTCVEVREAVARNANAPIRIIETAMSRSGTNRVNNGARSTRKLDADGRWYLNNTTQSGNLQSKNIWGENDFLDILNSDDSHLLRSLASYPDLPMYAYEQLAAMKNAGVKTNLAKRGCIPSHLQVLLASVGNWEVQQALVKNAFVTIEVLDVLAYVGLNNEIREAANDRIAKLLA